MSREKQIEEMADKLCTTSYFCSTEDWDSCNQVDGEYCDRCRKLAERLYNAGYRKQSEGEWKTEDTMLGKCCTCSVCGGCPTMEYRYCPYCGAKMKGGAE